jgi:outer membrane lipoprotein-sorting protein
MLGAILGDDFDVSFEAEEVVITFSDAGTPEVSRYKIGRLAPYKMRRDKYRLDGSLEEMMVRDEEIQIVSYPDKKVVVRSQRNTGTEKGALKSELVSLVRKNYDVKPLGREMVEGRRALVIVIAPKEEGTRPSFRVWLDHETGLPLKTETYSIDGTLSFLSALSGVAINPSFPRDYFVIMVPHGTKAFELPVVQAGGNGRVEEEKPAGMSYALKGGYILKETGVDDKGNRQSIYHDGLNTISVFSEDWNDALSRRMEKEAGRPKAILSKVRRGDFEGFYCSRNRNNILSFISGGHRYILVGEVSKKGLVDIAIDLRKEMDKR